MDESEEFRHFVKSLSARSSAAHPGPHLRADELIEFQQGRLEESAREQARLHLQACERCRAVFKDVNDFFEPSQEGEPSIPERETQRRLQALRQRVRAEVRADTAPEVTEKVRWWRASYWAYAALAANLIVFIGGGWLWHRQQQAWQARWTEQQKATRERIARLEAENQRRQQTEAQLRQQNDQANQEIAQLSERNKTLAAPALNIPIWDVYSTEAARRLGDTPVKRLARPPGAPWITLILHAESEAQYQDYSIELLNAQNQISWSAQGLVRQSPNFYTISIPAQLLRVGHYTIQVYGNADNQRARVETYRIRMVPSP